MADCFNYVLANLACVVFLGTVLFTLDRGVDKQISSVLLARITRMLVIYFIADSIWILFQTGVWPSNKTVMYIATIIPYLCLLITSWMWLLYCEVVQGNGQIQIYDLPFVTELLGISCEEVLSAGRNKTSFSGHVTNYNTASSQDRAVWEKYMQREDKLFLNFDEYGKSVIDYALDFKNYKFIKYLIDEGFIWLVDPNKAPDGLNYGAGTDVKRRDPRSADTDLPLEIQYQDELRTRTIALAIENNDVGILDSLLARQVPAMHLASLAGHPSVDLQANRNEELIEAVANADDTIVAYFSEELKVFNLQHRENTFLFPYLDSVMRKC